MQFLYCNWFRVLINQRHLAKKRIPTEFYRQMHPRIFQQKVQPKTPQTKPSTYLLFRLPYLGSISHHIEKELHQYTKTHLPDSKLRFIHNTNKLKQQFLVKDRQRRLIRSNIVYRLDCSCGSFYVGQTRRNFVKRLEEHQSSPNSEVCNHLQSNPSHKVDFHNPQILTSCPNKRKLLILESLYNQLLKPNQPGGSRANLTHEPHSSVMVRRFRKQKSCCHVIAIPSGWHRCPNPNCNARFWSKKR